ncbi:OmpA family protein [Magnetovibrio sp.]|uniref:OmpA family protein n=1 Tax=Magnetovibrio sp. TaxID=2024836 RepID=UPI002F9411F8
MFKSFKPTFAALSAVLMLGACADAGTPKPTTSTTPEEIAAFGEAIDHYRTLLAQNPDEIEAVLGLARNLRWAGRIDEAAEVLTAAVPMLASQPRFLAELGKVRLIQGDSATGVQLLQRATVNGTDDWRLYSALGIGNDYLQRYTEAQAAYKKALEMCPDDSAVMNNLGVSQGLSGHVDQAIFTFQEALSHGRHTDKITRNLKLFQNARDLCDSCSSDYLRQSGGMILAAGLMGTDREGPCAPAPQYTEAVAPVMVEKLAPEAPAPSINIKVFFEFDSAILKPEAMDVLDNLGEALTYGELNNYRFQIAGHTDAVGSEGYNQKLSQHRAKSVLDYLVTTFGIDPARVDPVGYGESQLLDPENPEGDINRRVQVTRLERMAETQKP